MFKSKFERVRASYMVSPENPVDNGFRKTPYGWVYLANSEYFSHYSKGERYKNFLISEVLSSKKRGETLLVCHAGIYFPE